MSIEPGYFAPTVEARQAAVRRELERRVAAQERAQAVGPGGVTGGHIAAATITANHISANSITATHIVAGTITADHIAARTITAGHIVTGTLTANEIAAGTITATNIAADTIVAGNIAAGTITAVEIAAGTITAEKITAGTITATQIAAGAITSGVIAAGTITATNIAAGTITGSLIASATLTGDKLVSGAVTADKISVADLSAVSASMGTLTAGVIQGGKIRTAASGARVELGPSIVTSQGTYTGLVGVDASNNVTLLADAATGNVEIKGTIKSGSSGLGNIAGQINGGTAIVDNTIPGGKLVVDAVTAREIAASTITAVEIAAATITGGKIAAGTITGSLIAAGAITADKITVGVGGANMLRNSSFEDSTNLLAGWTISGSSEATSATPKHGAKVLKLVNRSGVAASLFAHTAPADRPRALPGEPYTGSGYCFANAGIAMVANLTFYDGAGAAISIHDGPVLASAGRFFQRLTVTATAPAGTVTVRLVLQGQGVPDLGDFFIDAAQVEQGDLPTAYGPKPDEILPQSVGTTEILPGSITTGLLTATAIDGMTITGPLLRTSATNPKLEFTTTGINMIDTGNVRVLEINPSNEPQIVMGRSNFVSTSRARIYSNLANVKYDIQLRSDPGVTVASWDGTAGRPIAASAFNLTSDVDFKDQIAPVPNALETLRLLDAVGYVVNDDPERETTPTVGLIAQEVEAVFPAAGRTVNLGDGEDATPYSSYDLPAIVALLVQAVGELRDAHVHAGLEPRAAVEDKLAVAERRLALLDANLDATVPKLAARLDEARAEVQKYRDELVAA